MTKFRALFAIFLGTAVYVFVSLFGGQDGFWAAKQLLEQQSVISERTKAIAAINEELSFEYTSLKQDPGIIAAYARKLGYVADAEKLVKITGLPVRSPIIYDPGTIVKRQDVTCIPEWICKLSGILVSSLTFMALLLFGAVKSRKQV
jgi:cell division protein FtsB